MSHRRPRVRRAKWLLSPWGTGFAYVRRDLVPTLEPREVGWLAVRGADRFQPARRLRSLVARRRAPLRDQHAPVSGSGRLLYQSVEMLLDIGIDCIASHVTALIDAMMARLGDAGAAVVTPADRARRAGILTVRANHAERVSDRLANAGIVCGLREGGIRLSPHFYTTPEDIHVRRDGGPGRRGLNSKDRGGRALFRKGTWRIRARFIQPAPTRTRAPFRSRRCPPGKQAIPAKRLVRRGRRSPLT